MVLHRIAYPLRHGRRFGLTSASFVFLLAVADVEAALFGAATVLRLPVDLLSVDYQLAALPIACLVALATTAAFGTVLRRRASRVARAH